MFKHYSTRVWDSNSDLISKKLNLEKCNAYLFPNLDTALVELSFGLSLNFPHKKKIIFSQTFGSHYYCVHTRLIKFDFKTVDFLDEDFDEKLTESLFALADIDNPITGELNINIDRVKDKNIYKIFVNHNIYRSKGFPKTVDKRSAEIFVLGSGKALALVGEKYQYMPIYSHTLLTELDVKDFEIKKTENRDWVTKIEGSNWNGAKKWFQNNEPRLYDRAVIYFDDQNGENIAHQLQKKYQIDDKFIRAVNYCEGDLGYQQKFFNDPRVRGLIIIDANISNQITSLD